MKQYDNDRVVIINRYRNSRLDTVAAMLIGCNVSVTVLYGTAEDEEYEAPNIIITDVFSEQEAEFCLNVCNNFDHSPFFIFLSPYMAVIRKCEQRRNPHAVFLLEPVDPCQIVNAIKSILGQKATTIV